MSRIHRRNSTFKEFVLKTLRLDESRFCHLPRNATKAASRSTVRVRVCLMSRHLFKKKKKKKKCAKRIYGLSTSGYRESHFVVQTKFGCHNTFWRTCPPGWSHMGGGLHVTTPFGEHDPPPKWIRDKGVDFAPQLPSTASGYFTWTEQNCQERKLCSRLFEDWRPTCGRPQKAKQQPLGDLLSTFFSWNLNCWKSQTGSWICFIS